MISFLSNSAMILDGLICVCVFFWFNQIQRQCIFSTLGSDKKIMDYPEKGQNKIQKH